MAAAKTKKAIDNAKNVDGRIGLFASLRNRIFGVPAASAQQTIPYISMYRDGICHVSDKYYSKTIAFGDLNYELANKEDQNKILDNWCDFLNFFDDSITMQMSFVSRSGNMRELQRYIEIKPQNDGFDNIRKEFSGMLKDQAASGQNGLVKSKYITFGVNADSLATAKTKLERVDAGVASALKLTGVSATSLNGKERVEALFYQMHPDGKEKLDFSWQDAASSGMSTKDYIAPTSFDFGDGKAFRVGKHHCAVSFIQILSNQLNDRFLSKILELEYSITVTIHVKAVDQQSAIKMIKRKLTDVDKMKIDEQKKAIQSGYDMDIISPNIAEYGETASEFLDGLQNRDERLFLTTILVMNTARSREKLEQDIAAVSGITQQYVNSPLRRCDYQQELGWESSLLLGSNRVRIDRGLTTSALSGFVPFTTQELFQEGETVYYGRNALSNNLIMCDRKRLKNPNGLFLGTPGSGKSFAAKREMANVFLTTKDDIIICDPEGEYFPLVSRFGGQVIKLSPSSSQYINPMDISADYAADDDPIALKSDFIMSLCEQILVSNSGIQPGEVSIIDRCVKKIYQKYLADPKPENMPILQDLYDMLLECANSGDRDAEYVAKSLEVYVEGSLNVFNNRTNVDINNRMVCYDIKELGKQLKPIGMLILQDQVWGRVAKNRKSGRYTWYYCDEFHLLLKSEQTASYSVEIWKRFRKWGGIPTALTQNVKDLLASREIENIFENSDFIYMLSQASGDQQILAKALGISEHQLGHVKQPTPGQGLLFYGQTIIPFVDRFPKDIELYGIMTTKPEEIAKQEEARKTKEYEEAETIRKAAAKKERMAAAAAAIEEAKKRAMESKAKKNS